MFDGRITIRNNKALESNGGGISLRQSTLEINGPSYVSDNQAMRGGGVHVSSSSITVLGGVLHISNNTAKFGGGIYLETNPELYIRKQNQEVADDLLVFSGNIANYGGAIYVDDKTSSDACSLPTECFLQSLSYYAGTFKDVNLKNIAFSKNTALEKGPDLFGGLLDRCVASPFSEIYLSQSTEYKGIDYIRNITNITFGTIASLPLRVCFCNSDGIQDCNYQPPPITVRKGEPFTVSLVAIDQISNSVSANIISSLASHEGGLGEGQQTQRVGENCTELHFNIFSPHNSETITFHADGPCGSSPYSIQQLSIQFLNCTCPVGFEPCKGKTTSCECVCHTRLSPYIAECNSTTKSLLLRSNTSAWISYSNITDPPGFVIQPNCPFDYCNRPNDGNVSINFFVPNGVDTQCAHNRTGILCGSCQQPLSLSLGSSHCLPCENYWPGLLVAITLAAIISGILLVAILLFLNMTVSVGLVNIFIFYANIVGSSTTIFFPSSKPRLSAIFVSWLNLDIGIDVCFFRGLDTYTKTWLQLAFPAYIISLVVIVIKVSEYSPRFARLIGRKNPIATLATLILLSYAKVLSVTITILSYSTLYYPDDSKEIVWLQDGNVKFFQGKHIALVVMAILIVIVGTPYTIVLFLWQWLVRAPKWKLLKWTRNTRLLAFIASYHAPYNSRYRYWTGLLLLVRVILYITTSVTVSANPQTLPLTINILVGCLFVLKGGIGSRVYKKPFVDIVDTVVYFNILALATFRLYDSKTSIAIHTAAAYISTITTFALLVVAIIYQVTLLITDKRKKRDVDRVTLEEKAPSQISSAELKPKITTSVIDIQTPKCLPQNGSSNNDLDFVEEIDSDRMKSSYQLSQL